VPAYDVPEVELVEAGPCYQPHDPHARIISVGGRWLPDRALSWPDAEHLIDNLSAVTGVTAEPVRDEARLAKWVAQETVHRADRLARAIRQASRAADVALSFWRRASAVCERGREFTDFLEAYRLVHRCEEELRERLVTTKR
jgi:hypothetical protein